MAKVELKQPIVQEIAAQIDGAQSVVVVDYRGLTVSEDTQLRKELREAGVSYKVYKNTLMNFAFKGTEFEALAPVLEGPNAIAISKEDATAPARILAKFAKTAPALEIKAGVVEGDYMMQQECRQLQAFRPDRIFFPNYLEASSLRSQTSLALSTRSQSRVVLQTASQQLLRKLRQQKKHRQSNPVMKLRIAA